MRGEDLRIGNYFYSNNFKTYDDVLIVKSVFKNKATVYSEKQNLEFNVSINPELKPIPLTKEWLLKLGFERSKGEIQNEGDSIYRLRDSDDESFYISFGENPMICIDGFGGLHYLDYVHELQNLYSTLGIQELKLKQS